MDILQRKGIVNPSEPYVCGICGGKCKTNFDLKKPFKQLHERERQKKLNRLRSLKGNKRQRYKERFISGNQKYNEAARDLIKPKVGYGLASELSRAGVFVKTVEDKPQAATWAVKRQMQHSMSRGIDWLFLVSDDSDFSAMLRMANLGTVVVGDLDRAGHWGGTLIYGFLGWGLRMERFRRMIWFPRTGRREGFAKDEGFFSVSHYDGDIHRVSDLDGVVDELIAMRTEFNDLTVR